MVLMCNEVIKLLNGYYKGYDIKNTELKNSDFACYIGTLRYYGNNFVSCLSHH